MNLTVSPQIRLVALAGFVAALALAAGMILLNGQRHSAAAPAAVKPVHARAGARGGTFSGGKVSTPTGTRTAAPGAPAKPVAKPPNQAVLAAVRAGLPPRVAKAFGAHRTVVLSLYAPNSQVDQLAVHEASTGAALGKATFVRIDVTRGREKELRMLASNLGALEAPAVLVFEPGAALFVRLTGFADHELVAQAALNAAS